jgi:hypothetical protein
MSIASVGGGASSLSQLLAAQQAQSLSATSADLYPSGGTDTSEPDVSTSNALTGTSQSSLDSQTLQALMNLTQQDPASSDPTQTSQSSKSNQVGHHHHHRGGGVQQPSNPSASTTASTTSSADPTAVAGTDTDSDTIEASLTSALLSV